MFVSSAVRFGAVLAQQAHESKSEFLDRCHAQVSKENDAYKDYQQTVLNRSKDACVLKWNLGFRYEWGKETTEPKKRWAYLSDDSQGRLDWTQYQQVLTYYDQQKELLKAIWHRDAAAQALNDAAKERLKQAKDAMLAVLFTHPGV